MLSIEQEIIINEQLSKETSSEFVKVLINEKIPQLYWGEQNRQEAMRISVKSLL